MKSHQKMCWNCDGHVHVYELQCPYCGADLTEHQEVDEEWEEETEEKEDESTALVTQEEEVDPPPFQEFLEEERLDLTEEEESWEKTEKKADPDLDNPLASLLLLLPGSLFFLFGLALFLFSKDGVLVFQFKAKYWFVYLLGSWPLLYLGYRSLFTTEKTMKKNS